MPQTIVDFFDIKSGDLLPMLIVQLQDGNRNPIDLSSHPTVTFSMAPGIGLPPVVNNQSCAIVNGPTGIVSYQWQAGDTNTTGTFLGEFTVYEPGSEPESFPNDHYISIVIRPKLRT